LLISFSLLFLLRGPNSFQAKRFPSIWSAIVSTAWHRTEPGLGEVLDHKTVTVLNWRNGKNSLPEGRQKYISSLLIPYSASDCCWNRAIHSRISNQYIARKCAVYCHYYSLEPSNQTGWGETIFLPWDRNPSLNEWLNSGLMAEVFEVNHDSVGFLRAFASKVCNMRSIKNQDWPLCGSERLTGRLIKFDVYKSINRNDNQSYGANQQSYIIYGITLLITAIALTIIGLWRATFVAYRYDGSNRALWEFGIGVALILFAQTIGPLGLILIASATGF